MNKRTQQLLEELREPGRHRCDCGAVYYPRSWMPMTRKRAVEDGVLEQCGCSIDDTIYVALRVSNTKWRPGMCDSRGTSGKGQGRPGKQKCRMCGATIVVEQREGDRVFYPPHEKPDKGK